MVASGSISVIAFSCSEEEKNSSNTPTVEQPQVAPDLTEAIQKRIEKKPAEAIALLRTYNQNFPNSPDILIQLSRSLLDNKQYSLAAFRFEQAISAGGPVGLLLECAEAYMLAQDLKSARDKYLIHLKSFPNDSQTWLSLARILAEIGQNTEALNAFEKSGDTPTALDCVSAGNLYLRKSIYVKAQYWFEKSLKKQTDPIENALLGLLEIKLALKDESSAESLIFDIEKSFPGSIDTSPYRKEYVSILQKRNLAQFTELGIIPQGLSATELINQLQSEPAAQADPVVSAGPKLSPLLSEDSILADPSDEYTEETVDPSLSENTSLADAFSGSNDELIEPSPLELGWSAYLSGNYRTALLHARDAIKENNTESEAWRLSSQTHFQLGEIREAEMTILEAIRHNPKELKTWIDYLNIARETLSSSRYLAELEKTHERFPESGEILWQLARRYHNVERMPVTAGILYRRLLKITPEGSGLHEQAKMELIKIQSL